MIIYLSLLIAVIGLLMYALSVNAKLVEIGRIMFWVGLLCFLLGDAQLVNVVRGH
jgi:Na+/phosphate symporter